MKRKPPRLTDNQKELREGRLKELRQLHGGRLTRKEKEEFEALTDKEQEMQLGVIRSFNLHMELGERLAVEAVLIFGPQPGPPSGPIACADTKTETLVAGRFEGGSGSA
jgi:hypothetical protein